MGCGVGRGDVGQPAVRGGCWVLDGGWGMVEGIRTVRLGCAGVPSDSDAASLTISWHSCLIAPAVLAALELLV